MAPQQRVCEYNWSLPSENLLQLSAFCQRGDFGARTREAAGEVSGKTSCSGRDACTRARTSGLAGRQSGVPQFQYCASGLAATVQLFFFFFSAVEALYTVDDGFEIVCVRSPRQNTAQTKTQTHRRRGSGPGLEEARSVCQSEASYYNNPTKNPTGKCRIFLIFDSTFPATPSLKVVALLRL